MDVSKYIKQSRPYLKDSSIKTYITSVNKLYENSGNTLPIKDLKFLTNKKAMVDTVNLEKKITSKKNLLTVILVLLQGGKTTDNVLVKFYTEKLAGLMSDYTKHMSTQTRTEKQDKNWIEYDELIKLFNELQDKVKSLDTTKSTIPDKQLDLIQQLLVFKLYMDMPLRNDFADVKILTSKAYKKLSEKEKDSSNYITTDDWKLLLNDYKTVTHYGRKVYSIGKDLEGILKLWLKFNTTGDLLIGISTKTKMSRNALGKYLKRLFKSIAGKDNVSSSMLRHIQISHDLKGKESLIKQQKEADDGDNKYLNNSSTRELVYRKIEK